METFETQSDWAHLDEIREALLPALLEGVIFSGWTEAALATAARQTGIDPGAVELALPKGVADMITYWSLRCDKIMQARFDQADTASMPVREKVIFAVKARLMAIGDENRDAAARATARLALPDQVREGSRLLWRASDAIWRALDDSSTDFNYYSKRTILSAVLGSTLAVWFEGDDDKAFAFLDRRIENVMQFEKFKGKMRKKRELAGDPLALLARLRYGTGRARRRRM